MALARFTIDSILVAAGLVLTTKSQQFEKGEYKRPPDINPGFDIIYPNVRAQRLLGRAVVSNLQL